MILPTRTLSSRIPATRVRDLPVKASVNVRKRQSTSNVRLKALAARQNNRGAVDGIVLDGEQRVVHTVERERCGLWSNSQATGDFQEIARVRTRHIRDAAHLALAPQQAIVIEFRNPIQMDGVDRNHTAFAETGERRDHHVAAGSKRDRAI